MAVRSAMTPSWVTVEKIGLALAGVEADTSYGSPALKLRGQMFACVPTNKEAEQNSVVVRIDLAQRDELLAAEPEVYYLKEHYVNYPCVLARLKKIHPDALRDLIGMAWAYVDKKAPRRRSVKKAREMKAKKRTSR